MDSETPLDPGTAFRQAVPEDRAFVERIYFATHRHIIENLFGWRGEDVECRKFAESYDEKNSAIIVIEGEEAGFKLYMEVR